MSLLVEVQEFLLLLLLLLTRSHFRQIFVILLSQSIHLFRFHLIINISKDLCFLSSGQSLHQWTLYPLLYRRALFLHHTLGCCCIFPTPSIRHHFLSQFHLILLASLLHIHNPIYLYLRIELYLLELELKPYDPVVSCVTENNQPNSISSLSFDHKYYHYHHHQRLLPIFHWV